MTTSLIIRIALVAIIVSVMGHVIDNAGGKKEYTTIVQLCGFILVLYWVIPYIVELFETIQKLLDFA